MNQELKQGVYEFLLRQTSGYAEPMAITLTTRMHYSETRRHHVDRVAGDQFVRGEELLDQREVYRDDKSADAKAEKLAPYQEKIDAYCEQLDDKPLRFPATIASYGTERSWIRRFIEDYVLEFDCLPQDKHSIEVKSGGNTYTGGKHDFGSWKES
jgi:hypothetical protein